MSLTDPVPASQIAPAKALPVATPAQMARIHDTARSFEASLITQMLGPMFEGIKTDGPFSGGSAEGTYRTFMMDAIGKQMSKAGGIGVASSVEREMLKLQGLSEGPSFAKASEGGPSASWAKENLSSEAPAGA